MMDAVRTSDGKMVMLKKVTEATQTEEASILHFFSAPPQGVDPRNHTVPVIEILTLPHYENMQIVVMPYLVPFDNPPFETVGEGVHFIQQALEVNRELFYREKRCQQNLCFQAIYFLHHNFVAHR
jgi:hypothetical protein